MAICSPEAQAFRQAFSALAVAIHEPESLAAELYSKNVISQDVLRGVVYNTQTSFRTRTLSLLLAVEDNIKINPSAMGVFLSILKGKPATEHLADTLFDECCFLRGLDVIGETSFIVFANRAQSFHWVGYGLKLHIPQDVLPANVEECRLLIKVGLSGKFTLPPDLSLMSAIYWLDTEPRCKFSKPITLEVQHCASPTQSSQLSFVHAKCSQKELPYSLKILEGGVFLSHTSYGSIELSPFSFAAVAGNGEPQYCAGLYYTGNDLTTRKAHFVITKNFDACVTAVCRFDLQDATLGPYCEVEFDQDFIELDIPQTGMTKDGWAIHPLVYPQITKKEVDRYTAGKRTPSCQLRLKWTGEEHVKPSDLFHQIRLIGAKAPRNFITIYVQHSEGASVAVKANPSGKTSENYPYTNCHRIACKQDLYTMLADIGNWQSLCIYLGVPEAVLSNLVNEDLENNDRREKCLAAYFDQGEACWEKVIEVVAGHPFYNKKLATQIAQKYGVSWQD